MAVLATLVVGGILIQVLRPDSEPPKPTGLRVSATASFPGGTAPLTVTDIATDGDLPSDNESLWEPVARGRRPVLQEFAFPRADRIDASRRPLRVDPGDRTRNVDVSSSPASSDA